MAAAAAAVVVEEVAAVVVEVAVVVIYNQMNYNSPDLANKMPYIHFLNVVMVDMVYNFSYHLYPSTWDKSLVRHKNNYKNK